MSDIKKIAADIRHRAEWHDPVKIEWADALDALASQSQEPVAEVHSGQLRWLVQDEAQPNNCTLYAAPQPAPPQPAVPESFENALHTFGEQFALARASVLSGNWTTDEQYDAAKSEILRLYALASAAPQRPTVSREALWTAYANELRKGTPVGAFDNFCVALRALSIEVQE